MRENGSLALIPNSDSLPVFNVLGSPGSNDINLPGGTQTLNSFVDNPLDKELLIKLTDPFNRETYVEYRGQNETVFDLKYYGNTMQVKGGDITKTMVGDKRGVADCIYYIKSLRRYSSFMVCCAVANYFNDHWTNH